MARHFAALAAAFAAALCLGSCASKPEARPAPAAGTSAITGTVRLVPHEGLPSHSGSSAYGDRRLRDVELVDYSKPGSSVVYLDLAARPGGRTALTVDDSLAGPRFSPRFAVVGAGGEVVIRNRTHTPVVVSAPAIDRVERIAPGARWVVNADRAGPLEIFLLGTDAPARVWVSPGPWAQPDAGGRYELSGLAPGHATVRAWHPRLPSAAAEVELQAGETATVNFEIGVGRGEGGQHETH